MYSKQELAQLKKTFWTSFGRYMAPVPSAEGIKVNWVNYKTGIKNLHFKMQADADAASISITLAQTSPEQRAFMFNRFVQCKPALQSFLQEEWQWAAQANSENGQLAARIYTSLPGVSIYKKDDWPLIISFLKPRIIALDAFWTEYKPLFENI